VTSTNNFKVQTALTISDSPRLIAAYYPARTDIINRERPLQLDTHIHHFFEIIYIESGVGEHIIGKEIFQATPGDLFLIAPGQIHNTQGLQNANKWIVGFGLDALDSSRSEANIFPILFDELLLLSFFQPEDDQRNHFKIEDNQRPFWETRLKELYDELESKALGYREAARALLTLMLTDIARRTSDRVKNFSSPARPLLIKVFRFIEAHYQEPISLQKVAMAVGLSPAYLTDTIRRETGRSVGAWIVERRMVEARQLLLETNATVQQVAKTIGYQYSGHFIRQFKQLHGTTPQRWRQTQHPG
jgi:AraC-like DNA-binding protein